MRRLSPLSRRRLANFRRNRRGWFSLWAFGLLLLLSLGAELVANDKPLLLGYQGSLYFPAFKRYTEQQFGGQLPFQPDYRSQYVRQLIEGQGGWMLFAPIPFSADTPNYDLQVPTPSPPSASNWLGTDDQAYSELAMEGAILEHRYDLQYVLYLLALHRQLRARLPDYDYDRHVGGAVFLFLRGVHAASQGLYFIKPPRVLIERLDALFSGASAPQQPDLFSGDSA